MNKLIRGALVALMFVAAAPAQATLWNFSYTGTSVVGGSGSLDSYVLVLDVNAANVVVGISGTSNIFGTVTGLLAPGAFELNDNLFSPSFPFFTNFGLSFTLSGPRFVNLYFAAGTGVIAFNCADSTCSDPSSGYLTTGPASAAVAVTEPATLALLAFGLSGLALARRRRLH